MFRGCARRSKIKGRAKTQRGRSQKQNEFARRTPLSHHGSYLSILKSANSTGGVGQRFEGPSFFHKAPLIFLSSIFQFAKACLAHAFQCSFEARIQVRGLFGMLLLVAASSHAQTQRTVKVEEPEEGRIHWLLPKISQEVIKAFSTRIAATTRSTLEGSPAELVVVIICLESRKDSLAGGFCTYKFEYHAKKIPEFNMPLWPPRLVTRSEASELGG